MDNDIDDTVNMEESMMQEVVIEDGTAATDCLDETE